jgi:hypothetical protein
MFLFAQIQSYALRPYSNAPAVMRFMEISHTNSTLALLCCVNDSKLKLNSVAYVRERTIPTERPPPVGEVSANFCG